MTPPKKLKVLFLSRWMWEENRRTRGTGTSQQLAEALVALGHEVVVLSQSPHVRALEESQLGFLEVWLTPREKRRNGFTSFWDKLAKQRYGHRKVYSDVADLRDFMAKRGPFDVLYGQSEEPDGLIAALAVKRGIPLPPIVTQIQALRYSFSNGKQTFSDQISFSTVFKYATLVLANSNLVARDILDHYSQLTGRDALKEKTRVLPHNLTRTFIDTASNTTTTEMPEKCRVLFLGALNEKKGALLFLKSLPFCCAANAPKGVSFAIIGDYTEDDPIFVARWKAAVHETQAELAAFSTRLTIEFLGKLKSDEVLREIKRATVVVMPSLYDEFSRAIAEALASGRPVITTDKVGAAELISTRQMPTQTALDEADATWDTDESAPGFVVRSNDARMLGWAIAASLDPFAPQLENARRVAPSIRTQLSPEAIAEKLVSYFYEAQALGK